jgi:carbamoyltransferase
MSGALLGPSFSEMEIKEFLISNNIDFIKYEKDIIFDVISDEILKGKVIGWFQGRMEFGPRALGNRSIVGDPRNPEMQSRMNLKIKNRESFRPFAPAVLKEHLNTYFDLEIDSPYMLLVATVKKEWLIDVDLQITGLDKINQKRSIIPAITHVNNTARIQTVAKETNPEFYNLIENFFKKTGIPMLINTSFNVNNEPVVCSIEDAFKCFKGCDMDVLVLGNFVIHK